jgi:hypothetical protein
MIGFRRMHEMRGVPVEASVAAIFAPIWPLLPTPVTITRPEIEPRVSTARVKGTQPVVERGSKSLEPGFLGLDGANGRSKDLRCWQSLA